MQQINTSVTNRSNVCDSLYSGKQFLTHIHINILISSNVILMVCNVAANSAVIYMLVSKKLLKKLSMKLILYLSISDCIVAAFTQPLFILMLARFSIRLNCTFDIIAQFVIVFTKHISGYIIALIGYDRYCKMKYLNRYPEVVRSWKVHGAVLTVILLSFLQGVAYAVGTYLDVFEVVYLIAVSTDVCVIICVFVAYILTVGIVKKHRRLSVNRKILLRADQSTTSMASRILLAVLLFYVPYIIMGTLRPSIKSTGKKRQNFNFALFMSYELVFVSSFANAVIFLTLHLKCPCKFSSVDKTKRNSQNTKINVVLFECITSPKHPTAQTNNCVVVARCWKTRKFFSCLRLLNGNNIIHL